MKESYTPADVALHRLFHQSVKQISALEDGKSFILKMDSIFSGISPNGYSRVKENRPMAGYILPIGLVMSYLASLNNRDGNIGKTIVMLHLRNTAAAKHLSRQAQLNALKQDLTDYVNGLSHTPYQLNKTVNALDSVHAVIKNFLRSIAKEGFNHLLLTGRDAWWFAVVADRLGIPYSYDSSLSRSVSASRSGYEVFKSMVYRAGPKPVFVDTGFMGSVLKNLMKYNNSGDMPEIPIRLLSANRRQEYDGEIIQSLMNFGLSRNYALSLEYLPKANKTGCLEYSCKIKQPPNRNQLELVFWFLFTAWFYLAETPNFVERKMTQMLYQNQY